ncbi:hypothetical protein DV735_g3773, partial [Chaetothyriales sp. CBS 134920]
MPSPSYAANFLHNIIPAKILGVGTAPIYTAFLSAQGRILQDVFVYPPSWEGEKKHEWLVEVDADSATDLLKHLKKHKLRAKFAMELLSGHDPRPGMGTRLVLNSAVQQAVRSRIEQRHHHSSSSNDSVDPPVVNDAPLEQYTIHRMLNGLAEGQREIISGQALPQESNLDFLGGIDFYKGCYLGQELTIRTHHTGVVRKRILPCQLYDENKQHQQQTAPIFTHNAHSTPIGLPPPESNITKVAATQQRRGRSTGKWLHGVGNIGLALCRLEMMTDIRLTAETAAATYSPEDEYQIEWEALVAPPQQPPQDGGGGPAVVVGRSARIRPFVPAWVRR